MSVTLNRAYSKAPAANSNPNVNPSLPGPVGVEQAAIRLGNVEDEESEAEDICAVEGDCDIKLS
jgi:hypothetical protein